MSQGKLVVENLSITFHRYDTQLEKEHVQTVDQLSLEMHEGEILAVVGASGSGKSLLAHAILGILPDNADVTGRLFFEGQEINPEKMKEIRGKRIALIPQSVNYLDPILTIKKQLLLTDKGNEEKLDALMQRLGLLPEVKEMYPHQLSGGMARRVLFLTAMMSDADVIIADEPTPGMHLEQAMESLSILSYLAKEEGKSIMLITHDIDLAVEFSDRIAVFSNGKIVDLMPCVTFMEGPTSDWSLFTTHLWKALPQNDFKI